MSLTHELRLAAVALQFLTRVPVRLAGWDPQWLHDSARHFPLVGAAVGAWGAMVLAAALQFWPPMVAVALSMAATAWATGGFHEDGLADTCDGLGGAVTRERALAIMKDSRLGSYGALGLVLTLLVKAAALTALAGQGAALAAAALVLAHGLSRAATVLLLRLPYGGDIEHAKAKPLAQRIGAGGLAAALGWCVLLLGGLGALGASAWAPAALAHGLSPARLAGALGAAAAVVTLCGRWLMQRLGGFTGDALGATQQWSEAAIYLALAAGAPL